MAQQSRTHQGIRARVDVTEATWRQFRALSTGRGLTIAEQLARLVKRELAAHEREQAKRLAKSKVTEREIARIEKEVA